MVEASVGRKGIILRPTVLIDKSVSLASQLEESEAGGEGGAGPRHHLGECRDAAADRRRAEPLPSARATDQQSQHLDDHAFSSPADSSVCTPMGPVNLVEMDDMTF
jgi:hypothetical protein